MAELLPDALSLEAAAIRHGAYRWAEQQLFALSGAWAAAPGLSDAVRLHLFEASAQHGWHAELWADRLPALAGTDPDECTRPAGPVLGALFAALPAPGALRGAAVGGEVSGELAWLAACYRVALPRLVVTYRAHLRRADAETAGPSLRALTLVLRDEEAQLIEGEALLEGLLRDDGAVRAVAALTGRLESIAATGGAGAGLLPW